MSSARQEPAATGEWGEWSSWTSCSASCSTGITVRSRRCQHPHLLPVASLLSSGDESVRCLGADKEIKLCSKQVCSNGQRGWREEECSKYNTSVHAGEQYIWEPFLHPSDPCKLTCRAKGHHFYANLADRVIDGTPCGVSSSSPAVCVQGVCEEVGCDDIVGSPWRPDACGVCKGDNSTCRRVSGVFSSLTLAPGLTQITVIPVGSTLINVTGLQYSINWLTLQFSNGQSILNGGIKQSAAGDYEAAGTTFSYKTSKECPGQCIFAQGPIDQAIKLMLNTRGRNRGVVYSFNVPVNVTDSYFRRIIDNAEPYNDLPESSSKLDKPDPGSTTNAAGKIKNDLDDYSLIENEDDDSLDDSTEESHEDDDESKEGDSEDDDESEEGDSEDDDESEEGDSEDDESEEDSEEEKKDSEEGDYSNSDAGPNSVKVNGNSVSQGNESDAVTQVNTGLSNSTYWPAKSDSKHNRGDNDSEASDSLDHQGIGNSDFKITVKEKPRFIEPVDNRNGLMASRGFEFQSSSEAIQDEDGDNATHLSQALEWNSPTANLSDTMQALEDQASDKDKTEEDLAGTVSDQAQPGDSNRDTPTSEPDHLLHPQSDSPFHYRTSSNFNKDHFRRPKYSQSFTFGGRYHQSDDDKAAGYLAGGSRSSSRPGLPGSRQIRIRQGPREQSPQTRQTSGFSGYDNFSPISGSRTDQLPGRSASQWQRQALTQGQSLSRNQDGALQLQSGSHATRSRNSDSVYDAASRQYSREEENRRRQQGSERQQQEYARQQENERQQQEYTRQQQEYARQQEEYQRELLKRRQELEEQRAAQNAEYQRRLEEHKRKLRQRQMEDEERRRQRGPQQQHRHRHTHGNQGRQPSQSPSAPSGGIMSRAGQPFPVQPGGNVPRQGTTEVRQTSPSEASRSGSIGAASEDRGRLQQTVFTDPRQSSRTSETDPISSSHPEKDSEDPFSWSPTPAPTRRFLSRPAQPPASPTSPVVTSDTATYIDGPEVPYLVPEEPRHDPRSSLTAASSNQLPANGESPLVIDQEGSLVTNVIESWPVIDGLGSISANDGGEKTSYEWRVSGLTECTLTCGGGLQQTVVVCLDTRTQAFVTDDNCEQVQRPKAQAVTCNTRPCPAEWQTSEWSSCNASCGPGEETRLVTCFARISATLNITVPDQNCRNSARPETRRACQTAPCNTWKTGNWSQCSVQCGEGMRTRDVMCVDQTEFDISDDLCAGSKPLREETCDMGPCGKGWYYTDWPEQCPAPCGSGSLTRRVTCLGEGGSPLPDSSCDEATRPVPDQECKADIPCGGEWFASEWEQCNVTCGRGYRVREVACLKALPGNLLAVVDEGNCVQDEVPETLEPCEVGTCSAEWYMTSWSQCSQSCGTGFRTREVKCLDPQQRPSSDCPLADKSRTREACNTDSCIVRPSPPGGSPSSSAVSDCRDSFSRCEIVRHARMCRYPYYQKVCCATCAEDT